MASRLADVARAPAAVAADVADVGGRRAAHATAERPMPAAAHESPAADWILRLLLDGIGAADGGTDATWESVVRLAERDRVLVRVADRMEQEGHRPSAALAAAAARERRRGRAVRDVVQALAEACRRHGIEHVFPTAFAHHPDVGGDIDLLVLERSPRVDAAIVAELRAVPVRRDVGSRIAGAAGYRVAGCAAVVDIHHGRLGVVGEHDRYASVLVRRGERVVVDGVACRVPSRDDRIVLLGLKGVHARRTLRLADVVQAVNAVRRGDLDWDYVVATAARECVLRGLGCHLALVEQIHRRLYAENLVPSDVRGRLPLAGWGRVEFRDGGHRHAVLRVAGRAYLGELGAALVARRWATASRLALVPVVAGAAIARRLAPERRGAAPAAGPERHAAGGA